MQSEILKPSHVEAYELLSSYAVKELCSKVTIFSSFFEHVINDGQQRVCHSHQPSFASAAVHHIASLGLEVAVLLMAGRPGSLYQGLP